MLAFLLFSNRNINLYQAKKYSLTNTYSDYSSILTYNETGFTDYSKLIDTFGEIADVVSATAGEMWIDNIQDQNLRTGLAVAGWLPQASDMAAHAVEWWQIGEFALPRSQEPQMLTLYHRFQCRIST